MPLATRRTGFLLALVLSLSTAAVTPLHADLVWDPVGGWRIEGGALERFFESPEGKNAKTIMDKARAAEEAGSERTALRGYNQVAKKYSGSVFAPEALFRSAKIYEGRRQFVKAQRNFQRIIAEHPAYPRFNEVLSAQYRLAETMAGGTRPRYFGVIPGFRQREKGLETFEQVVVNAPFGEYAPLALMNAAQGYTRAGDRDAAIDALDRMINNYPDSFLTPDAYLKLATTQASITQGPPYDQASTQLALTYFQDFLILYPGSEDAATANEGFDNARTLLAESKMNMGDFYYRYRSNYKAARVFFNEAITIHPESPVADRARALLARIDKIESGEISAPGHREGPRGKRFWLF